MGMVLVMSTSIPFMSDANRISAKPGANGVINPFGGMQQSMGRFMHELQQRALSSGNKEDERNIRVPKILVRQKKTRCNDQRSDLYPNQDQCLNRSTRIQRRNSLQELAINIQ